MQTNELPILIPYDPDVFWAKMRRIIQEEISKIEKVKEPDKVEEPLLQRKELAARLHISLVTLSDWVKRGMPSHKQRGKVYFLYSEVLEYLRKNHVKKLIHLQKTSLV
ncbi:MAG TPA: helix-turn-helix domain-containing protein [Flavisolibacter sp.]|nr:helix-turn-helix domain-containing protein [Flavisolibacter sp.]